MFYTYTNPNAYMYAFAINIVDSSIDMKICKAGAAKKNEPAAGKCTGFEEEKKDNAEHKKLSYAFSGAHATSNEKVDAVTSKTISGEVAALTREEKGTVASVFAKVIEGAEVLETKGVSATSVMVNACYDLVGESIGVVPYASWAIQ